MGMNSIASIKVTLQNAVAVEHCLSSAFCSDTPLKHTADRFAVLSVAPIPSLQINI